MATKNFKDEEFACKCGCGFMSPNPKLLSLLEAIRSALGNHPIHVNSGCRCADHNWDVGGAKNSQHILGNAADIRSDRATPEEISFIANEILGPSGGVKAYDTFCHVDVRAGYWRG